MKIKDLRGVLDELSNVGIFAREEPSGVSTVYGSVYRGSFQGLLYDWDDWRIDQMFTECNSLHILISER